MQDDATQDPSSARSWLASQIDRVLGAMAVVALILGAVTVGIYVLRFRSRPLSADPADWGAMGDYLGGLLNPTFAFLALIAVLLTVVLQVSELELTRNELKRSTKALNAQTHNLELQNFDRTFFSLLDFHNQIVQDLDLRKHGSEPTAGRDCFRPFFGRFKSHYDAWAAKFPAQPAPKVIHDAYDGFLSEEQANIGHYFRHLYHIFKFLRYHHLEVPGAPADRHFYAALVRAQLSSYELALLFYNGLSGPGAPFKPLIEHFHLLHNLDRALLLDSKSNIPLYDPGAFGKAPADASAS